MAKLNAVPFHQKEYWESRFEKEKHFEWLLTWQHIQTELEPYFDKNENILHPGCGNSELAFQIADCGYKTIVNVDYAENVIEHMKTVTQEKQTKENKDYSDMSWYAADCMNDLATQLPPQKNYGIIIDKSLVDTIACGDDDLQTRVKSLAKELLSVAKPNAVWCSISFSGEREFYVDDYQGNSYWRTEEKIPIEVHQPNDKPGAPAIYYYIYISRKVQSSSLS